MSDSSAKDYETTALGLREINKLLQDKKINGIKKRDLKGKTPLTQPEVDELIQLFELDKRIILTYGSLDERFIKNYFICKRLLGYEKKRFNNFKHDIISSRFSEGSITKDNLCMLFGIEGCRRFIREKMTACLNGSYLKNLTVDDF